MAELGEGIAAAFKKWGRNKWLFVAIENVIFDSGIDIYDVESGGAEKLLPPGGTPHWGGGRVYPAVYVRRGGAGETNDLKVKVKWSQSGCDGAARLEGTSNDGKIVAAGNFNIAGARGNAEVSCTFSQKPDVVANYGRGIGIKWKVDASGETETAPGGSPLRLFFLDCDPNPVVWNYAWHYLKVIDWATSWAEGTQGTAAVFNALWSKFSDGARARTSHATGFSYWKTNEPVQNLKSLIAPDSPVRKKGWSCQAIAHLFMECLALHGIQCMEVVISKPAGTLMFLVQNWNRRATTIPNWEQGDTIYYGGSWVDIEKAPLNKPVKTSLKKEVFASGPVPEIGGRPTALTNEPIEIDLKKMPGVPAQGQTLAPLGFENHWIVEVFGRLYDTSYGADHANNINTYAQGALAGWLIGMLQDGYKGGLFWLTAKDSGAWLCHELSLHALQRDDGAHN
jgi:hypothetical protein